MIIKKFYLKNMMEQSIKFDGYITFVKNQPRNIKIIDMYNRLYEIYTSVAINNENINN
jgi:hypothetical protein